MVKFFWMGATSLAGLGILIWIIGMLLPSQVTIARTTEIKASPAVVFQTVTDVAAQTRWRKDIKSVRVQLSGDAWTEETTTGTVIDFQVRHQQPNTQFEIEFISRQGFSGTWVGIFVASPSGTMVQFTETIYIQNPILRIISRIFSFPDRLIDTYLMELKAAVEKS
jgi:uncharacterized protein YndB with AHSA1/START domain